MMNYFIFILVVAILVFSSMGFESVSSQTFYIANEISLDGSPASAIINENTNTIYVTDFFGAKLHIINGTTNEIVDSIDVVKTPFGIGINPITERLYVGGEFENIISVIDESSLISIKDVSLKDPYDFAVDTKKNLIYVTSDKTDTVFVIDGNTNEMINSFNVIKPCGISINSDTGMVYVTSESENLLHVWDGNTNQQITTLNVGNSPRGVTVNPTTNTVYVTNQEDNTMSVIDGTNNQIIETVPVGEVPRRVVADWQKNIIYVSNHKSDNVSVIDGITNELISNVSVKEPFEMAINQKTGNVYAMYYGEGISVITKGHLEAPLKQISKGIEPEDITCKENLALIIKASNLQPACVKESSIEKLIQRGWALEK